MAFSRDDIEAAIAVSLQTAHQEQEATNQVVKAQQHLTDEEALAMALSLSSIDVTQQDQDSSATMRQRCFAARQAAQQIPAEQAMQNHRLRLTNGSFRSVKQLTDRTDPFELQSHRELTPRTGMTDFGPTVLVPSTHADDGFFCRPLPLLSSSRTSGLVMTEVQTDQHAVSALMVLVEEKRGNCKCHLCTAGPLPKLSHEDQRRWWLNELNRLAERCKTYTPA